MSILNINRKFIQSQLYGLKQSTSEGFLLIELIVALMMMGIFMGVFVQYQVLHIRWRYEAQRRIIALAKSTSLLEKFIADPDSVRPLSYKEGGYAVIITKMPTSSLSDMQVITVTIKWDNWQQKEQSIVLETMAPATSYG